MAQDKCRRNAARTAVGLFALVAFGSVALLSISIAPHIYKEAPARRESIDPELIAARSGPEDAHRVQWTVGVPGEGLLLAEVNSDADAVDGAGDVKSAEHGEVPHSSRWHKPLLPLNSWDIATAILASLGLMIAAAGGIGGGGILVPIYILVLQFTPKHAVPLSNITIFGGAITNTYLNMKKRHPYADRPLIDWDLILVMEPLTIGGALVGSFIQKVLPEVILTLMMVLLLLVTADRTLRKGVKTFKKESHQQKADGDVQAVNGILPEKVRSNLLGDSAKAQASYGAAASAPNGNGHFRPAKLNPRVAAAIGANVADEENAAMMSTTPNSPDMIVETEGSVVDKGETLKEILEEERRTPLSKVALMTAVFAVLLTVNILKGGGAFASPLGIECGSLAFWATSTLSLVYLLLVSLAVRNHLVKRWRLKTEVGYAYAEGDVEWSPMNTVRYPAICFFAGFFAGMFGVGGGIVKGPLMLEMGVHPMVASSTSAVMILYTSFTATTSFVVFGVLKLDYAMPLFVLGLVATAAGQAGTDYLVKKFKRPSFIILSIGSVVALSAVLMGYNGVEHLLFEAESGATEDGGICAAGE